MVSIGNEVNDYNLKSPKLKKQLVELLDYYKEPIYKATKKVVCKQLMIDFEDVDDIDYQFIDQFDIKTFINDLCSKITEKTSIENINFIIIGKMIHFYKLAQLDLLYNYGVDEIEVETNINSCNVCKDRFKNKIKIEDIDETMIHPYCCTKFKI